MVVTRVIPILPVVGTLFSEWDQASQIQPEAIIPFLDAVQVPRIRRVQTTPFLELVLDNPILLDIEIPSMEQFPAPQIRPATPIPFSEFGPVVPIRKAATTLSLE